MLGGDNWHLGDSASGIFKWWTTEGSVICSTAVRGHRLLIAGHRELILIWFSFLLQNSGLMHEPWESTTTSKGSTAKFSVTALNLSAELEYLARQLGVTESALSHEIFTSVKVLS